MEKCKIYMVIKDTSTDDMFKGAFKPFRPGEPVIALQSGDCGYCVRLTKFTGSLNPFDYDMSVCHALFSDGLEEVEL